MEEVIKNVAITTLMGWDAARWHYKVILMEQGKYKIEVWLYDEYDDYLTQWKIYHASPELDTLEEAEKYISEWIEKVG